MNINFKIYPIILNQRLTPYFGRTADKFQIKVQLYSDEKMRPLNIEGIPINLYLNSGYGWELFDSGISNRFGYCNFEESCSGISVPSCLSQIRIPTTDYISNTSRINFISPIITAVFYNINSSGGLNGVINPSGDTSVLSNSDQSYSMTPDYGYMIEDVLVDSGSVGSVSGYTFSGVTSNHTISVSFTSLPTFNIYSTNGTNGIIDPSGTVTVFSGYNQIFLMDPDPNYEVEDVLVDSGSVGAIEIYTFSGVISEHTISVTFIEKDILSSLYKGENNLIDSLGGNNMEGYQPSYSGGYEGNGFLVNDSNPMMVDPRTYTVPNLALYRIAERQIFDFKLWNQGISVNKGFSTWRIVDSGVRDLVRVDIVNSGPGNNKITLNIWDGSGYVNQIHNVMFGTNYLDLSNWNLFKYVYNSGQWDIYINDNIVVPVEYKNVTISGDTNLYLIFSPWAECSYTSNLMDEVYINSDALSTYYITSTGNLSGSISPSGMVPVTSGASRIFTITPAAGYYVADVIVDSGSLGSGTTSYTFSGVTTNHTITANFSGLVYYFNIYSSTGLGGSISPSGTIPVLSGSNQTFTIIPTSGYEIGDVLIDSGSIGVVSGYTFSGVTSEHTISANFNLLMYNIYASSGPNGIISPSGNISVGYGSGQSFIITPNLNYQINDVIVDSGSIGAVSGYTFSGVINNHTISGSFTNITHNIYASSGPNGLISPSGTIVVNQGSNQSFTLTPSSYYEIDSVIVDSGSVGSISGYTFSGVNSTHTISGSFKLINYTIYASGGLNGVIYPSGNTTVTYISGQSYTITPDSGYLIKDVLVDSGSVGPISGYTFSGVTSNRTITASFSGIPTFNIYSYAGPNGSISPSGTVAVTSGTNKTFTLIPNTNYQIADVLVDSGSVGAVSGYTFSGVVANHTISGSFSEIVYRSLYRGESNLNDSISTNDMLCSGTPLYVSGYSGNCFRITSSDQYFTVPNFSLYELPRRQAFSAQWYGKGHGTSGVVGLIIPVSGGNPEDNRLFASFPNNGLSISFEVRQGWNPDGWWDTGYQYYYGDPVGVGLLFDPTVWNKFKVTYTSGQWELYINDVQKTPFNNDYKTFTITSGDMATSLSFTGPTVCSGTVPVLLDEVYLNPA